MEETSQFILPHELSAIRFELCCIFIVIGYVVTQAAATVLHPDSLSTPL